MKKIGYIAIGIMIGSVLTFGVGAAADSISLVGKKISGETDVLVNGVKLGTAIIVNGSSYAPVRVIGEAAGFEVGFVNKKVVLGAPKGEVTNPVETQTDTKKERIAEIKKRGAAIDDRNSEIIMIGFSQADTLTEQQKEAYKLEIESLKIEADELKKELAELEKQ
ncbi:hypothetical protein AB4Z29_00280 [Paenibacillus sp. 2TAB23]|uniref:hypothetical protein n=1 Tax=Paenibacillus sp. 2TAB23 TaxID=3233004 RepID=UPI003F986961